MSVSLPPDQLAARLIELNKTDALAQATRLVAEASVGGTSDDADLCAALMNALIPMLAAETT